MRITAMLDPDLAAKLQALARGRGVSFSEALLVVANLGRLPGVLQSALAGDELPPPPAGLTV